jgi:hypothetical protein
MLFYKVYKLIAARQLDEVDADVNVAVTSSPSHNFIRVAEWTFIFLFVTAFVDCH